MVTHYIVDGTDFCQSIFSINDDGDLQVICFNVVSQKLTMRDKMLRKVEVSHNPTFTQFWLGLEGNLDFGVANAKNKQLFPAHLSTL